jgi:hypothetical protein
MQERLFRVPRPRKSTPAQLAARARYAANHPERIKARRQARAQQLSEYCKQRRINLRIEVLTHYSPEGVLGCSWPGCTIIDIDMLVLDHIEDDGAQERKTLGGKNARGLEFLWPPQISQFSCQISNLVLQSQSQKRIASCA